MCSGRAGSPPVETGLVGSYCRDSELTSVEPPWSPKRLAAAGLLGVNSRSGHGRLTISLCGTVWARAHRITSDEAGLFR